MLSDIDIENLSKLHEFLTTSFKGSLYGNLKIDDAAESLWLVVVESIIEQQYRDEWKRLEKEQERIEKLQKETANE